MRLGRAGGVHHRDTDRINQGGCFDDTGCDVNESRDKRVESRVGHAVVCGARGSWNHDKFDDDVTMRETID